MKPHTSHQLVNIKRKKNEKFEKEVASQIIGQTSESKNAWGKNDGRSNPKKKEEEKKNVTR